MSNINSVLKLDRLVYDTIEFKRKGFANDNDISFEIAAKIADNADEEVYRVSLILNGDKEDEYTFTIALSGFFSFEAGADIPENMKKALLSKNAVAIMMPYLRSEVSILTAQPGVECVVLPVFNINKMFEENN